MYLNVPIFPSRKLFMALTCPPTGQHFRLIKERLILLIQLQKVQSMVNGHSCSQFCSVLITPIIKSLKINHFLNKHLSIKLPFLITSFCILSIPGCCTRHSLSFISPQFYKYLLNLISNTPKPCLICPYLISQNPILSHL